MKVGIIGTKQYENKMLIKDTLFNFSKNYDITIVTRGHTNKGAELYVKKFALYFNFKYIEIQSAFEKYTDYSIYHPNFYNKTWNYKYLIQQSMIFNNYIDTLILLGISENNNLYKFKDTSLQQIVNKAIIMNKDIIYVN